MHLISLISSRERFQYVLLSRDRIDWSLLSISQGHESVVGTIKSLVPSLVSRETVLDIWVNVECVFVEHLHALLVVQLLLERRVKLWCARVRSIRTSHLRLSWACEPLKRDRIVIDLRLDSKDILLVKVHGRLRHVFREFRLVQRLITLLTSQLSYSTEVRNNSFLKWILPYVSTIELKEVLGTQVLVTVDLTEDILSCSTGTQGDLR